MKKAYLISSQKVELKQSKNLKIWLMNLGLENQVIFQQKINHAKIY